MIVKRKKKEELRNEKGKEYEGFSKFTKSNV